MGTYTKVDIINLARLNNAEYLTFMNHVVDLARGEESDEPETPETVSLAAAEGAPELGLSEELLGGIEAELLDLSDNVDESTAAEETEEMETHEKNRDSLAAYILTRVQRAGSLPLEAERLAGKALYRTLKPYTGVTLLPVAQETAKLRGLLLDLRKPEAAPHVTTLGLDTYVTELEKENEAYDRLWQKRAKARAANKKESGASIRARVDEMYDDLVMLAQSYNVVQPTERSATFVRELNQYIAETVTANKLRKTSGSSKPSGTTDPEPTDPEQPGGTDPDEGTDLPFEPVDPNPEEEETPSVV